MGRFGYGTKEVLYPRFRKIEQVYRKRYNQRSRKHQLIYYAGFVMIYSVSFPFLIIVAMFVTEVVKTMIGENSGGSNHRSIYHKHSSFIYSSVWQAAKL